MDGLFKAGRCHERVPIADEWEFGVVANEKEQATKYDYHLQMINRDFGDAGTPFKTMLQRFYYEETLRIIAAAININESNARNNKLLFIRRVRTMPKQSINNEPEKRAV